MRAIYAREWVVIITNLTYLISTDEFEYGLNHYKEIMGGDLYYDNKAIFPASDYVKLYQNLLTKRRLILGRTGIGGGLGGGTTLGVDHWNFYSHYTSNHGWDVIAHELGHCLGFSHGSNLAGGGAEGFSAGYVWQIHNYLRKQKRLPYLDPKLLDFTNIQNEKYWAIGIEPSFLIPNDISETPVDKYFKDHPMVQKRNESLSRE